MKKNLVLLVLVLFVGLNAGESKEWYGFNEGLELALAENKPLVIDFYTDWCHWCKVMDEKTFSVPEVESYLFENFVPIRINAEDNAKTLEFKGHTLSARELTAAFQVTGYPAVAFLTPEQELLTVVPGYVKDDMFLNLLKFTSQECYKKDVTFDDFIKNGCEK